MTSTFALDPLASHSAQFPLGAPFDRVCDDEPSPAKTRPWALRGMAQQPHSGPVPMSRYDRELQVQVDSSGRPLTAGKEPTVKNKTDSDGDEGPSEDFSYDFVPDEPFQV